MELPKTKNEVLDAIIKFEQLLEDKSTEEFENDCEISILALLGGILLHSPLVIITLASKKLHFWTLVSICAKLRIKTDSWSTEPIRCGYNNAYTNLGLAKLHKKDIDGAIEALYTSSLVLPCPHNTTFGLSNELAKELKNIPQAYNIVEEYKKISSTFTSKMDKTLRKNNII